MAQNGNCIDNGRLKVHITLVEFTFYMPLGLTYTFALTTLIQTVYHAINNINLLTNPSYLDVFK